MILMLVIRVYKDPNAHGMQVMLLLSSAPSSAPAAASVVDAHSGLEVDRITLGANVVKVCATRTLRLFAASCKTFFNKRTDTF